MNRAELRRAFSRGSPIAREALADTEYKGISLGLPGFIEKLTWKKFKKVFARDPERDLVRGWNLRLEQNALDEACIPLKKNDETLSFGHFVVMEASGRKMPVPQSASLVLDYGLGENAWYEFTRVVRDPLVAVNADDATLLLGCMYLEIGFLRIPTPSYFTLEYDCPLSERLTPPGRRLR